MRASTQSRKQRGGRQRHQAEHQMAHQLRAGLEGVKERAGGGKLINALGDEGVRQPGARTGRTTVAAPCVAAGETPQIGERHDFAELLVQGAQRPEFGRDRAEKLALQLVENRREVSHGRQTRRTTFRSNKPEIPQQTGVLKEAHSCC